MTGKRCIILIDGSNFYFKLKDLDLHKLLEFGFSGFAKMLTGEGNKAVDATYFVGKIRIDGTEKTRRMFDNQQKLIGHLKNHSYKYSLGYLMKNGGVYYEKGVDVNIGVDILVATYEDLCERIILVSSDTDLIPAVNKAKEKGKIVEYVGFSHKPSVALVARCSESHLFKKEEIEPFVKVEVKEK